jgi:iron complex transport system substrate-binding protein
MAARSKSLAVALALLLCAHAPHAQARKPPERIVSLVPALTEILFAIGAGPQVIAVSNYDEDPPEVKKLPKVGALLDPDAERILSMRPDLVLIYGSQDSLRAQLTTAGIAYFDYRHAGLADIGPVFKELGEATGHVQEATIKWNQIQARIDAVRAKVAARPKPRTLLVMSRAPKSLRTLDASGGRGFLHDMVTIAGGTNIFADVKQQAVRVSTEMLLARAPEVVVDLHYGDAMKKADREAEQKAWDSLPSVPAVRQKRVHMLFGDYLVVPGPRVAQAIEDIAKAIHPEAFK